MKQKSRIFVAGHQGLVGSAIVRKLRNAGYDNLITRSRQDLDLLNQAQVQAFFRDTEIDYVFLAAAKVGGIQANYEHQADFLYENLVIAANVIQAAAQSAVKKLLFLGSSCIYPKMAVQPIRESALLTGALEPSNEGYAIAKIAGLKLCEMFSRQYAKTFISAMPTNLYGTNDNFHPLNSHVIPGMMRRFHEAKIDKKDQVQIWGTGAVLRDFLHVDDLAEALFILMCDYDDHSTVNVGSGYEISIAQLAQLMKEVVGFEGNIVFDATRLDGTPRKMLKLSKIKALGWLPRIPLLAGLKSTYDWACQAGIFEQVVNAPSLQPTSVYEAIR